MRLFKVFICVAIISAFSCQTKQGSNLKNQVKPNIIYILADDLGYGEVGVYGQKKIETPNIDQLANDGMIFTQHYTGAPVCAPARCVLLTGKHMGHSAIRGNDEWNERGSVWDYRAVAKDSTLEGQRPLPSNTITLANLLQKAEYKTGMIGKWGLGAPHTESIPNRMGFDYFFGYNCQRQAHTYNPIHLYENENRFYLGNDTLPPSTGLFENEDPLVLESYARFNQSAYAPEISFEKLMGFVKQNKNDPFFLYWASPIPHLPLQAPKAWVDHYVKKFGDEKPYAYIDGEKGNYFPSRYPRATYAAMVSYLDENIGKLILYLKDEGLYDNTLIIFTSDNGPSYTGGTDSPWFESGGPFESTYGRGKGFLYEGGIRVPMITSWPNQIRAGTTSEHVSAFWDVLPTFCEITNQKIPHNLDGLSFLNAMTQNKEQEKHEYLYWEFPEYQGQVAVRKGPWKLIWKEIKKGNQKVELYNLDEDAGEKKDVSSSHPEILEEFYAIIKKEHETPEVNRFKIEALEELLND